VCQQFELELKGRENSGVLQKYFLHRETADEDEFGRTNINKLSVASVHHIGIFDIRIANEDRHGGNLLLDENSYDGAPCLVQSIMSLRCLPGTPWETPLFVGALGLRY